MYIPMVNVYIMSYYSQAEHGDYKTKPSHPVMVTKLSTNKCTFQSDWNQQILQQLCTKLVGGKGTK